MADVVGLHIDWLDDGFDGQDTVDDVTRYIREISYKRGGTYEITGSAQAGTATILLKNPNGRFTPENTESPLYPNVAVGKRVWFGINNDWTLAPNDLATVRGRFAGIITNISPLPLPGLDDPPSVEILCEDPLGATRRLASQSLLDLTGGAQFALGPVIENSKKRTQGGLRALLAGYAFEQGTFDMDNEITPLPISYLEPGEDVLKMLTDLNAANGTRHFIRAGNSPGEWFTYATRNRQWKLGSTGDVALTEVKSISGWQSSVEAVIDYQEAEAEIVDFELGMRPLWTYDAVPLTIYPSVEYGGTADETDFFLTVELEDVAMLHEWAPGGGYQPWPQFFYHDNNEDLVIETDAIRFVDYVAGVTLVGSHAYIGIRHLGTTGTLGTAPLIITKLAVGGYQIIRGSTQKISVPPGFQVLGENAGPSLSGPLLGPLPTARGMAQHMVWRYGTPKKRPTVAVQDWPSAFDVDLYDTVSLDLPQLRVAGMVLEIVGIEERIRAIGLDRPALVYDTLTLQESRVQDGTTFFRWDVDLLDDPAHPWAY